MHNISIGPRNITYIKDNLLTSRRRLIYLIEIWFHGEKSIFKYYLVSIIVPSHDYLQILKLHSIKIIMEIIAVDNKKKKSRLFSSKMIL